MNRRELFKTLTGAAAAIGLGGGAQTMNSRRYGPVTVERHQSMARAGIHLHVFHEGRDITKDCTYADDTDDGMAVVLLRNENGQHYLVHGEFEHWAVPEHLRPGPAQAVVRGVTIRAGTPL